MSEELQELINSNPEWYKNLQYDDVKKFIQDNINSAARSFIAIGYYLKYARDNAQYIEDGYNTIWEFAKGEFGIGKSSASQYMSINDKFSKDGNSPVLLEKYREFSSSKLSEMLTMTEEQLEEVTPATTIVEIRQIKKPVEPEPEVIPDTVLTSEQAKPKSIDDLELSVRTYNCLKRAGIDTINELCDLTEDDVIKIRNFSRKCMDDIQEKLSEIGRELKLDGQPVVNVIPEIEEADTEVITDVNKNMDPEPDPVEIVEADIIQTEPEESDDEEEQEVIDPEHYTYRDVDDELDKLTEYVEMYRKNNDTALGRRKSKMRYDAIVLLDKEMKKKPEVIEPDPVQPELPILKNNDQRKNFVDAYATWPLWIDMEQTGERYYRYDLSDKVAMVVKVSRKHHHESWKETKDYEYGAEQYYLLGIKSEWTSKGGSMVEDDTRTFYECNTNKSSLIDYLKDFQKKK